MTQAATGAAQPSSRREAREQERRTQRRVVVPSIRPARSAVSTAAPFAAVEAKAPRTPKRTDAARTRSGSHGPMRTLMSMGAMLGVAAMLVSTSISGLSPAGESAEASQTLADGAIVQAEPQSLGVVSGSAPAGAEVARDSYTAEAYVPPVRWVSQSTASPSASFAYTNNPNGSIQWPFPLPSPISYGFGPRAACSYCSSYHLGVDFTPGAGVPIQAITEGVVSAVILDSGGLGNHVIVDHVVNGQRIQSVYAHMAWGSIQVAAGQPVSVGTILGAVGSTGASTGAHLHLEIHADGTPIDPFAWLKANAN
ncbi:M23 family metallopeptidase [Salinibacterium sp. SYSU T00001]|uniref:M23 family metallopeptidase n=1 Tax=Homoserinimonas sedimenticola TaxID=2986805 RepID=UPI00223697CF|nr:M23 family metallopeptidase [Salinibacterium sedimenticola]MCW4385983.1 M23 family metallopeptidase [Salinibacterium sedimenticola]